MRLGVFVGDTSGDAERRDGESYIVESYNKEDGEWELWEDQTFDSYEDLAYEMEQWFNDENMPSSSNYWLRIVDLDEYGQANRIDDKNGEILL